MVLFLLLWISMEPADLHGQNQEVLTALLSTDLELAHTFLEIAETTDDSEHRAASFAHAKNAVESLRTLFRWIEDPVTRKRFETRADKLELELKRAAKLTPVS
jgi:hypothetical protein